MEKKIAFAGIGVAVLVIGVLLSPLLQQKSSPPSVVFLTGSGEVSVQVEIADSDQERQRGLMERTFLGENEGMLFIFDGEASLTFWMKNTIIPLDMIFIDKDKRVVNIQNAIPCESDPCSLYPSAGLANYVVEVNGGFAAAKGIGMGDTVRFNIDRDL